MSLPADLSADFDATAVPAVPAEEDGARHAAPSSGLARLRARREAAAAKLHLDLPVPRMDPPVYVRFTPVPAPALTRMQRKFRDYKGDDGDLRLNASLIAQACVGIFERDADGVPVGLNGAHDPAGWPRFDPELATGLGLQADAGAVATVLALYLTDGDVLATGAKLGEWSGFSGAQLLEDEQGN
jgi:hypothetical protein